MTLVESASIPDAEQIEADVCVVGAGAAGLALAVGFGRSRLTVAVLESGGLQPKPEAEAMADFENVGAPLRAAEPVRNRQYGGTMNGWYGRLALLDEIDFERRPWVPLSGWPIRASEVFGHAGRAASYFGLRSPDALDPAFWERDAGFARLRSRSLRPGVHIWPRRVSTAKLHLAGLRRSQRVRVLLRAQARRLVTSDGGGRVDSVSVEGLDGNSFSVRARAYVLACGGLENPRLLLLSRVSDPHDVIGRHYMNHPRTDGVARLRLGSGGIERRAAIRSLLERRDRRTGGRVQFCLRPSEGLQRGEELLNCCSFLYGVSPRGVRGVGDVLRLPPAIRRVAGRLPGRASPVDHLAVVDQVEQVPDPSSRVTLGEARDRFGDPQLRLSWSIGGDSVRTLRRVHELLAEQMTRAGAGTLESELLGDPEYDPPFTDAAHPMGTTRMSHDPGAGVVDENCRVHGVSNLYVAGSSVFPTGGNAPPTFTIACLAFRLSDHLAGLL